MIQNSARLICVPARLRENTRSLAVVLLVASGLLISLSAKPAERIFQARGIVRGLDFNEKIVSIQHEAISNFMAAMTMPFTVKSTNELAGLSVGDKISFELHVTETESWIDGISKIGTASPDKNQSPTNQQISGTQKNPLWYCKFTNELGQAVSLNDFHGQALAVTFIYTRCPLPNACRRLSKNFQEAEQKLEAMPSAPTNWHFISFTFDPDYDTPDVLKNYGKLYNYNPAHWSFLTGSPEKIAELTRLSDLKVEFDDGLIKHNFRTFVVDATGHLQTVFPISGDFSDSIVAEMLKGVAATNPPVSKLQSGKSL
jgi:protein SCO1